MNFMIPVFLSNAVSIYGHEALPRIKVMLSGLMARVRLCLSFNLNSEVSFSVGLFTIIFLVFCSDYIQISEAIGVLKSRLKGTEQSKLRGIY